MKYNKKRHRLPKCAGGCAAKIGQSDLEEILSDLVIPQNADVLLGPVHGADSGVYRVSPTRAITQSVDFFPPMIPDPYFFGQVAATNALSDLYALGSKPVSVLNILGSPKGFSKKILNQILKGAADKTREAGAALLGGHSVVTGEVLFGLSVTGIVHPKKWLKNTDCRLGDLLLLTKPLGTGILVHSFNADVITENDLPIKSMTTLNCLAGDNLIAFKANASTDITGFGFLGHALDMLSTQKLCFQIEYSKVPKFPRVESLALEGRFPGGSRRNLEFLKKRVVFRSANKAAPYILNDAQTSGGLLISAPPKAAEKFLRLLEQKKYPLEAAIIGKVIKPRVDLKPQTIEVI